MKFRKSKIVRQTCTSRRYGKLQQQVAITVRKIGNRFSATLADRTVLGEYPTIAAAIEAAESLAEMVGEEHICTPSDIVKVRKELWRAAK